jgi:hypothetical protein
MRRTTTVWKWAVVCSFLWTLPCQAAVLDPLAFTSLGTLNTTDSISINTDTLQLAGGASYTGVLDPVSGASLFTFDEITGTNLSIFGTRTLGLMSKGNLSFTGTIDLLGTGGLAMAAEGLLALNNLNAVGSGGGAIQLQANTVTLSGSINFASRSLSITSVTDLMLPGGSGVPRIIPSFIIASGVEGAPSVFLTRTNAPVPLPASLWLFATGLTAFGLWKRRTK